MSQAQIEPLLLGIKAVLLSQIVADDTYATCNGGTVSGNRAKDAMKELAEIEGMIGG